MNFGGLLSPNYQTPGFRIPGNSPLAPMGQGAVPTAYQPGPYGLLARQMAGNVTLPPINAVPGRSSDGSSTGGNLGGALGDLAQINNNTGNPLGNLLGGAPSLAEFGSGAAANGALADAGFGGSSAAFLGGEGTGVGTGALTPLAPAGALGLGAFGSGAAANSALLGAGFGGSSAGFLGGAGTGIGSGALTPLGAAGGSSAVGGSGAAGALSGGLSGAATAIPAFGAALIGMNALGNQTEKKYADIDATKNAIIQSGMDYGLGLLLPFGLNTTGKSGSRATNRRSDGSHRAYESLVVLPNGRQLDISGSDGRSLVAAFKTGNADKIKAEIASLVDSNAGWGMGDSMYSDPSVYTTKYWTEG